MLLHKFSTVVIIFLLSFGYAKGQDTLRLIPVQNEFGFVYAKGITWTENRKQDSVIDISIEKDTMLAVRNLLVYCLQEKNEGVYARILLSFLNLDHIKSLIKNKEFDFYLKEYRKAIYKNKIVRGKQLPSY